MKEINKAIKDVFGDVPASFEGAAQVALGSIPGGRRDITSEEDDSLRAGIVEAFSYVKADKHTPEKVMQKYSTPKHG